MLVAVIADTHLPRGGRRLPPRCVEIIAACDALVHAGDFVTSSVLQDLRSIGAPVHAVSGNVDEPSVRQELPAELVVNLGRHRVAVVHDSGPRRGRLARLRERFPDSDAVIFGHSHLPEDGEVDGFRIFNPGSPTERRRASTRCMGVLQVTPERIDFEHIALP